MTRGLAATLGLTAAVAIHLLASPAFAASLAGEKGDVRRSPFFSPYATGGCKSAWKKYVAASGHSAYAMTLRSPAGTSICGAAYNAGSQQAAESRALASCQGGLKRYKVGVVGKCEIAASK